YADQEVLMSRIRFLFPLLLTIAFLPGTLAAQYWQRDSGQYVILSAQYGTERHHADVTGRLKELAREDMAFRMGNSTFGVDPDPGRIKTLRIYARGERKGTRLNSCHVSSTYAGLRLRGWGRGDWGRSDWRGDWEGGGGGSRGGYNQDSGQYVILSAQYATERLHALSLHDALPISREDMAFRMGNSTFGVDPDPGRIKTLRIYARGPRGDERMFEYREGSTVDGSQFRGWRRGEWGRGRWDGRWEEHDRD